jgi:hypothetical protein
MENSETNLLPNASTIYRLKMGHLRLKPIQNFIPMWCILLRGVHVNGVNDI